MKIFILSIFLFKSLFGISEFSVSGVPIKYCSTLYQIKLHNDTIRYHCSLQSIYEDKQNYGILQDSIKIYDNNKNKFIISHAFDSYTKKEYQKDLKKNLIYENKYILPYGKNIFQYYCVNKNIDFNSLFEYYFEILDLLNDMDSICAVNENKYKYFLAKYLWIKKNKNYQSNMENIEKLQVKKEDKCPVCGMFVSKYPKWVAQIFTNKTHFTFDGVKDMMKFYLNPKEWNHKYSSLDIKEIKVSDYYSNKAIDAKKSFYVLGSDVYGPMGRELIPFEHLEQAKEFKIDHNAKKILQFKEIDKDLLKNLD